MKIAEFRKISSIDSPNFISSVVFVSGCNFSCPSCHARNVVYGKEKISEEEVFSYLDFAKGFVDAVVLCGGEPTTQPYSELECFCKELKARGKVVKLDTNGYKPEVLRSLLEKKLVDYVAMDIKGPNYLYSELVRVDVDVRKIEESLRFLTSLSAENYEFRTTIAPRIVNGKLEWMSGVLVGDMAGWIQKNTGMSDCRWYVQPFVSRAREEMMDERFSLEQLPKEMRETPSQVLEEVRDTIRKYFPNCNVR